MENKAVEKIIPPQQEGVESNTVSTVTLDTLDEAKAFFEVVRQRLLHVNNWHQVAGAATADFKLTDAGGTEVDRTAQVGDHFRIDIPGPGPVTGDGYDWVRIEAIEEIREGDTDCVAIRVRPATNPHNDRQDVAHFFSESATSNFIVKREGATISAEVHGRNEKPNTAAETLIDKARNTAVATGAVTAFSKLQWKRLVNGLVKR